MLVQILEAETVCAIFKDNLALCNEVSDKVVQHFVHCIEIHGRHVQYLKFLQTIVKAENQFIRRCQDMVMQELINAGEDVLVFYNDKASFHHFIQLMQQHRTGQLADTSPLRYHVELVKLLACCTMGKNVYTEIKCNSLLALDDIVTMISHPSCCVEVKEAYVDFLNHCYIDTEVEMKEIYSSHYMWSLFERSFLADINYVVANDRLPVAAAAAAAAQRKAADAEERADRAQDRLLEAYVVNEVMNILSTYFNSPFSDQCTTLQTRQLIFVQLLQSTFRVSKCRWLTPAQKFNVENCIRTLSEVAKARGIAFPQELDDQVRMMFNKSAMLSRQTSKWLLAAKQTKVERSQSQLMRLDRSIIEGLQDIVSLLEDQLKPLVEAELSLLVDILYRSELLFPVGTESRKRCESGGFIRRLIKHTEKLLEEKEERLCVKVLRTLREMMAMDMEYGEKGDALRNILLNRYFYKELIAQSERALASSGGGGIAASAESLSAKQTVLGPLGAVPGAALAGAEPLRAFAVTIPQSPVAVTHGPGAKYLQRAGRTLHDVQSHLDREGASDLVVELVIKSVHSPSIFVEAVELGIALLEGGNPIIQKGMFNKFVAAELSQVFFKVRRTKSRHSNRLN